MSGDQTKDNIVRSVEALLKKSLLDSITVTAITKEAKVSRQTFYFHFDNVFDVYKWAVSFNLYVPQGLKSTVPPSLISLISVLRSMQTHKDFTIAVYNSSYRADLYNYVLSLNDTLCDDFVAQFATSSDLTEWERKLLRGYFNHAAAGTVLSWIGGGMDSDFSMFINSQEKLTRHVFRSDISEEIISKWSFSPLLDIRS